MRRGSRAELVIDLQVRAVHQKRGLGLHLTAFQRLGLEIADQATGARWGLSVQTIAAMDDYDLWMARFKDPNGHIVALRHDVPKGYRLTVS